MLTDVPAITQKTKYDCGAACCLYILQMLGIEPPGDAALPTIMKSVRTYSTTDRFGSAPGKIGNYILARSRTNNRNVEVRRGPAPPKRGGRFYLGVLDKDWATFPASGVSADPAFTKGATVAAYQNVAILRGLVRQKDDFWGGPLGCADAFQ